LLPSGDHRKNSYKQLEIFIKFNNISNDFFLLLVFTMDKMSFYSLLKKAEIVIPDFPLQGISILPPYGKGILDNLESAIKSRFLDLNYEQVGFPESIPHSFVEHLKKKGLFQGGNEFRNFYLSGSAEMQAAFTAGYLVRTYRHLPLKLYSKIKVHREIRPTTLIRDIEYRSYELNSFFPSYDESWEELATVNKVIQNTFIRFSKKLQ